MVTQTESRMWSILKERSENDPTRTVRIGYYSCNQLPVHKHQVTDIVKSWDNRGLVNAMSNGAVATLTKKGQGTIDLENPI